MSPIPLYIASGFLLIVLGYVLYLIWKSLQANIGFTLVLAFVSVGAIKEFIIEDTERREIISRGKREYTQITLGSNLHITVPGGFEENIEPGTMISVRYWCDGFAARVEKPFHLKIVQNEVFGDPVKE